MSIKFKEQYLQQTIFSLSDGAAARAGVCQNDTIVKVGILALHIFMER